MDHTRHLDVYNIPRHFKVGLVGAGGIGAMTALVLAKMGVRNLTVWDDDEVSETNIPVQLHRTDSIGLEKVFALESVLQEFSDEINYQGVPHRIEPSHAYVGHWAFEDKRYDLFITAVDSITARQEIWSEMTMNGAHIRWLYDMRMAAEQFQGFLVNMENAVAWNRYRDLLFGISEEDVEEVPCTAKATMYTSAISAGHAGKVVRDIVRMEATSHRLIHYIPQNQILAFNL